MMNTQCSNLIPFEAGPSSNHILAARPSYDFRRFDISSYRKNFAQARKNRRHEKYPRNNLRQSGFRRTASKFERIIDRPGTSTNVKRD